MGIIYDFQKKYGLIPDGIIGKKTMLKIKEILNIDTDEQLAHFMGQCSHESNNFDTLSENLNYSSNALLRTFSKYFDQKTALKYQRNPEMIANKVYANRMGNGDESSGDGWKHRGYGLIQTTGKNNQYAFAKYIGDEEIKVKPSIIATKYGFESAKYFFDVNNIWKYANTVDDNSIILVSKIINLGNVKSKLTPNGLEDRIKKTNFYYNIIKNK
jgi:putative chitinase